jgi:serine/threonine protein kinase
MTTDGSLLLGGRYEVLRPLDCGTRADLRLAYDTLLRRKVAVKVATTEGNSSRRARSEYPAGAFRREAEVSAGLQHPHLHPVYDYGRDGEIEFLVMRVFDATLREFIRRFTPPAFMPLDVALPLFQSIAGAIDYLHDHGPIVHGNLKPNTIVLDAEDKPHPHPFVSDLGVAVLGPAGIGTPLYMAPEQVTGEGVSGAADLYSFGILLYECLTGTLPFKGGNLPALLMQKLRPAEGQYSLRRIRPDLPLGIDLVIEGLTRVQPSERYRTATAASEEIARAFYRGQAAVEGTVFLSYAREQSDYVHELARRLRGLGVQLWIDLDIQPGTNWDSSVEDALQRSDMMVVVLSRAAVESETVRDEWSYFLDHGKDVYPLLYERCEVPLRLRRRQYIETTRDLLNDLARIVGMLAERKPNPPREGEVV